MADYLRAYLITNACFGLKTVFQASFTYLPAYLNIGLSPMYHWARGMAVFSINDDFIRMHLSYENRASMTWMHKAPFNSNLQFSQLVLQLSSFLKIPVNRLLQSNMLLHKSY